MNFYYGRLDGEYAIYYNCIPNRGNNISIGHAQNGVYFGSYEQYSESGQPLVKYQTDFDEKIVSVSFGTKSIAQQSFDSDRWHIRDLKDLNDNILEY